MSYILGALKKAEKDRKRDNALNFDNWDQEDWHKPDDSGPNSHIILYALLSALMLVLIIFAWLAYKILIMPNQALPPSSVAENVQPARIEVIDAGSSDVIPVDVEPSNTELPLSASTNTRSIKSTNKPVKEVQKPDKIFSSVRSEPERATVPINRPDLPEFSGHIYFPNNNRSSRIFSGANAYREGEEIDGYLVERIGEGQVTLNFAGKEFRIKLAN